MSESDGPPRGAIIAAVVLAVATIGGVLVYASVRQVDSPAAKVAIAAAPAPLSDSQQCHALMNALPAAMGDFHRATAVEPVPTGAAAWTQAAGTDPVIMRCGVERPTDFVVGTPLQVVDKVSWFEAKGDGASTWYAVDRGATGTYVALTLPEGSGPTPIQTLSELIATVLPPRPLDPAPAR